ncbi:hypothetical protein OIU84_028881 [Salix udensis]|uniref:Uncharacterized protein n=1 Tax=Salix udensis TaxID=889485 RepID=A0AAD6KFJ7_9ROSI|nr:hypothetical protein OIU84_028881 [Salix udensis]
MQRGLPDDVNFSFMLTFLEFYETLLGFVGFRLHLSINVKYPPIVDPQLEAITHFHGFPHLTRQLLFIMRRKA